MSTQKKASVGQNIVAELIEAAKHAGAKIDAGDKQTGELKLATYGSAGWAAAHKRFGLKG